MKPKKRKKKCPYCSKGVPYNDTSAYALCSNCNGTGEIEEIKSFVEHHEAQMKDKDEEIARLQYELEIKKEISGERDALQREVAGWKEVKKRYQIRCGKYRSALEKIAGLGLFKTTNETVEKMRDIARKALGCGNKGISLKD